MKVYRKLKFQCTKNGENSKLTTMLRSLVFVLLILSFSLSSDQSLKDRMKGDLDVIRSAFEAGYAPREWKKKYFGWDLSAEIAKCKERIDNMPDPTVREYQHLLRDFFNSMNDYHVRIHFYSTEKATLPFQVKGAQGRIFISYIDTERLSPQIFPVKVGDELIAFDHQPIQEVIENLQKEYLRNANPETDRAYAEYFLTFRSARLGHQVPKGPITISIRPKGSQEGSQKIVSYQLIWNHAQERVSNSFHHSSLAGKLSLFNLEMVDPLFETLFRTEARKELLPNEAPPPIFGYKKSLLPPLGRIWWDSDENFPFDAYIFETAQRKLIGFVRIPHFAGGEREAAAFAELIQNFEERTDALVIDQLDNPGGYIFYCYALASMLTDTPLSTPLNRIAITQEDVYNAVELIPEFENVTSDADAQSLLGETLFGLPVTYQMTRFFLNFFHFIEEEWNAGHQLTAPYFLASLNHINPHPQARYTKPILILINSLDISCGDIFPAIFQDNRRALLLGSKTAGAGGYVRKASFPNLFGIHHFHYTGSIAERADKNPIENLGVMPDIPYTLTENDLQNRYQDFVSIIRSTLQDL